MHIPDGYLGPKTWLTCYAVVAPFWWRAWVVVRQRFSSMEIPHIALASAFIFVIMMFNVPLPGGTTSHAVGASIAAIVLGPWAAILAVSLALFIQMLLFSDGGVTAFGANCLNMAVLQVMASVYIWNLLRPADVQKAAKRTFWAAFLAGYVGLLIAATATAFEFGIQPYLERMADGSPKYSPYPLSVAIPAMVLPHLLLSFLEGGITAFLVLALAKSPSTIMAEGSHLVPAPTLYKRKSFWLSVAAVLALLPLGLLLPKAFNSGEAWGEWAPEEAARRAGLAKVPPGMQKVSDMWKAPMPDYSISGTAMNENLQYIGSAIIGVVVIVLLFVSLGKWQKKRVEKLRE